LRPPSRPEEAGAGVAAAVVAGAAVVVVAGAAVDAGFPNRVLVVAGVALPGAAVVVAGFCPNRPLAGAVVAGAVVAGVALPKRLGAAAADEAAGAVVAGAGGNNDLGAAGSEPAGEAVLAVLPPAATPNSDFGPAAGAVVAGVLVLDVVAAVWAPPNSDGAPPAAEVWLGALPKSPPDAGAALLPAGGCAVVEAGVVV
jgi:hypothetical protein